MDRCATIDYGFLVGHPAVKEQLVAKDVTTPQDDQPPKPAKSRRSTRRSVNEGRSSILQRKKHLSLSMSRSKKAKG